jgi:hypothetical protein
MTSVPDSVPDEGTVVEYMKGLTLVGVLPVPHPIITRRYQPNQYTSLWFTTFLWGVVFLRSQGEQWCQRTGWWWVVVCGGRGRVYGCSEMSHGASALGGGGWWCVVDVGPCTCGGSGRLTSPRPSL